MRTTVLSLLFLLFTALYTAIPTQAEAASALFRMKRAWWGTGGFSPYISPYYHPPTKGPNKAPPAQCYVQIDTVPFPECGPIQSKVIEHTTGTRTCFPFGCRAGYPVSDTYPSYWNYEGKFQSNHPYAPTATTTVVFPTTMGNPSPPWASGDPTSPTTAFSGVYDFSRSGFITIIPGKNRFGGTMKFFDGPNHSYYQSITASSPYLFVGIGGRRGGMTGGSRLHYSYVGDFGAGRRIYRYLMTPSGQYKSYYHTSGSSYSYYTQIEQEVSTIAPWTTGTIQVGVAGGTSTQTLTLAGYDNRTSNGVSGVLSLIRPRLVHGYLVTSDPILPVVKTRSFAEIWQIKIHYLPEPVGIAMLAAGFAALAGVYRLRKR
jgi:hypothetical protein